MSLRRCYGTTLRAYLVSGTLLPIGNTLPRNEWQAAEIASLVGSMDPTPTEDYCRERWEWGHNYVNKQIQAAEIASVLGTMVPTPTSERQARELVPVLRDDPENLPRVWDDVQNRAMAEGRPITAGLINQVAPQTVINDIRSGVHFWTPDTITGDGDYKTQFSF